MYKQWSADLNSDAKLMWKQSESSLQPNGEKTSPISVILVSSGSRGNKLLFRYPFQKISENTSSAACKCSRILFCMSSWRFYWRLIFMSACDEYQPDTATSVIDTLQLIHFDTFPLSVTLLYTCSRHKELYFSWCVFLCH